MLINAQTSNPLESHFAHIDKKKIIPIYSKSDLIPDRKKVKVLGNEVIYVSSFSGEGINSLNAKIVEIALTR